jgi:prepilin-type N-terminal cleavage/methylation domain-containing protein
MPLQHIILNTMNSVRNRGFTLIELLVVIAIIGLLVSVVVASFGTVQRKGRDARRISDVNTIQKALALYDSTVGSFPIATTVTNLTGSDSVSTTLVSAQALPVMPRDPSYPVNTYTYQSNAQGNAYTISFCLETDSIPNYSSGCGNTLTP